MMYKNISTLVYNIRDSVVSISGHWLNDNTSTSGNGFFIKGHYIICPSILLFNKTKLPDRILVDISNVNNSGKSYSYEAELIGYDGAGNIGVLKINFEKDCNKGNPILRNSHQFLPWGKSRNANQGDQVLVVGKTVVLSENSVTTAIISDNRYVSNQGAGEMLLLSCSVSSAGLPVITLEGTIIGMMIENNIALSEFFMRRPVKTIIKKNYGEVDSFIDSNSRVRKSFLGVFGTLLTQDDYYTTMCESRKTLSKSRDICREILGYRIISLTSLSPLKEIIIPGDIITHINSCLLGNRKGQISPSLVMWRLIPQTKIILTYKKQEENFSQEHNIEVETLEYDPLYDFPLSSILI